MIHVDVEEILNIRVSPRHDSDFVAWNLEKTGLFTVRSAYHLGVEEKLRPQGDVSTSSRPSGDRPVWKMFWKIKVPQKVKICAWKMLVGGFTNKGKKKS
jgi:hypothetical protein